MHLRTSLSSSVRLLVSWAMEFSGGAFVTLSGWIDGSPYRRMEGLASAGPFFPCKEIRISELSPSLLRFPLGPGFFSSSRCPERRFAVSTCRLLKLPPDFCRIFPSILNCVIFSPSFEISLRSTLPQVSVSVSPFNATSLLAPGQDPKLVQTALFSPETVRCFGCLTYDFVFIPECLRYRFFALCDFSRVISCRLCHNSTTALPLPSGKVALPLPLFS